MPDNGDSLTGWTVRGSNLVEGEIFRTVQTGAGVHPASYTMRTGSFSGKNRPGRGVDHPPPSSAGQRKSRAIHLLPLSAFVACYKVEFNLTFYAF
jgi:predicted RNase H-like nuclease